MELFTGLTTQGDLECEPLEIDGEINLHIREVRIFTGPDSYSFSSGVEVTTTTEDISVRSIPGSQGMLSKYRSRGEPQLRIRLTAESEENNGYWLSISHHKGSVLLDLEKA